jgi:hypothetical protein
MNFVVIKMFLFSCYLLLVVVLLYCPQSVDIFTSLFVNCLALVMTAYWWMEHIHQSDPNVKIILVSEDPHLLSLAKEYEITAYSLQEYLLIYFKDNSTLLDLYESLAQSINGEDTTSEDILPTTFEEVSHNQNHNHKLHTFAHYQNS